MRFLLLLIFSTSLFAQGPQIPLTGNIGVPGSVAVLGGITVSLSSDANYTLTAQQWANKTIIVRSSVALTAVRNVVLPSNVGQEYNIENATSGGNAIQVIAATGTGVSVANGKSASVFFDGTNYVQISGSGSGGSGVPSLSFAGTDATGLPAAAAYTPVNKAGDTMTGTLSGPAYRSNGVGVTGTQAGYNFNVLTEGDSISCCTDVMRYYQTYPYKMANQFGWPISNIARPGSTVAAFASFLYPLSSGVPSTVESPNTLVTVVLGTNDVTANPTLNADLISDYSLGIQENYAFNLLQGSQYLASMRTLYQGSAVTLAKTGTWTSSLAFSADDPGQICTGTGCSLTVSYTGTNFYMATLMTPTNTATATVTCDGVAQTAPQFKGTGTTVMVQSQPGFYRAPLAAGNHVCVVQGTSSGTIGIQWVAGIPGTSVTSTRSVAAGYIFPRLPDTVSAAYRPSQAAAIAQLNGDGFPNIWLWDTTTVYTAVGTSFWDGSVHPIEYNHYKLAVSLTSSVATHFGIPNLAMPALVGNANYVPAGGQNVNFDSFSLNAMTTGVLNTGCPASNVSLTTGQGNTLCGVNAGGALVGGNYNTSYGTNNLLRGVNIASNTSVGNAGYQNLTGSSTGNTGIGFQHCNAATSSNYGICMGYNAGYQTSTLQGSTIANAISTDVGYTFTGSFSGKSVATVFTHDFGGYGYGALVGQDYAYEIGQGTNTVSHTLAYRGYPFVDDSGNVTANTSYSTTTGLITGVVSDQNFGSAYVSGDTLMLTGSGAGNGTVSVTSVSNGVPSFTNAAVGSGYQPAITYGLSCVSGTCGGTGFSLQFSSFGPPANSCVPTFGSFIILSFGSGFTAGDVYTVTDGNSAHGTGCNWTVGSVRNGVPVGLSITAGGFGYTVANDFATTGGSGTGGAINVTSITGTGGKFCYGSAGDCVTNNGSGTGTTIPTALNTGAVRSGFSVQGANYTMGAADMTVECTAAVTITLPATPGVGRIANIVDSGGGSCTVAGNGNTIGNISPTSTITVTTGTTARLQYNGAGVWRAL